jgi:hypothetical protein
MRSAVLVALLLSACTTTADVDIIDTSEPAGGPSIEDHALPNNAKVAFQYFVNKGLTATQSAGIVGNLMQESSVIPTAVEYGGGPGRGIAQWSVGGRWNSGSTDSVSHFAAQHGTSMTSLTTQLDFIWFELQNYSAYGLSSLRSATTLSSAVYAFQSKFEICGACAAGKRLTYAQQVLAAYGNSTTTPTPPADASCYSNTLGREMPENACVQSASDGEWYQCSAGSWVDRFSDPDPCNGEYPL